MVLPMLTGFICVFHFLTCNIELHCGLTSVIIFDLKNNDKQEKVCVCVCVHTVAYSVAIYY